MLPHSWGIRIKTAVFAAPVRCEYYRAMGRLKAHKRVVIERIERLRILQPPLTIAANGRAFVSGSREYEMELKRLAEMLSSEEFEELFKSRP
jgi:hypothetical protein